MKRFVISAVALSAALSAASFAAPASVRVVGSAPDASGGYTVRAVTVQYDDAELSNGGSALLARIQKAAEAVCISDGHMRATLVSKLERCRKEAVKGAVNAADIPALTQAAASN